MDIVSTIIDGVALPNAGRVTARCWPRHRTAVVLAWAMLAAGSRQSAAQSASQLGAWDGLILSPVGALAPVARDPRSLASGASDLSLRYGRWSYDDDDVVHDNIGVTWTHSFGVAQTQVAVTGAYAVVECPTCTGWVLGGVDVRSSLWTRAFARSRGRPIAVDAAWRVSLGGGRYRGADASTALSAAIAAPVTVVLPVGRASALRASIVPGVGFGRIASADLIESGVLPMIGAAVGWTMSSALWLDFGAQQIVLAGGPILMGAAIRWRPGHDARERP